MRGYTSNSSIHLYIISHFFPICKTFFEKNEFFRIFVIFLPFYRKNQENEKKRTCIVKCFKKNQKNLLTTLDNCDKILNCIIIAYCAHFCPLHIEYVGKSYNKRRVEIEFISFLFIYAYVKRRNRYKGNASASRQNGGQKIEWSG